MSARGWRHWASLGPLHLPLQTHAAGQLPRSHAHHGDTVLWWEGKSGCPVLSPSPLTCPSFSILLSRKIHRFLPLPARPPNLDQPLPSSSLFSLPFFLPSTFFFFLILSYLFIFQKAQEDLIFKMITRNKSKKNDENQSTLAL